MRYLCKVHIETLLTAKKLFTKQISTTLTFKYNTLQIYVPIIGSFIPNSWVLQLESYHHRNHTPPSNYCSCHTTLPHSPGHYKSRGLLLSWLFFYIFCSFFFCLDRGFTFSLLLPGASSLSSDTILLPGAMVLPHFMATVCFLAPILQCSFKTCNTES